MKKRDTDKILKIGPNVERLCADSDCLAQSLRNYFLESNAELFFVLGVAQNIRVNSHSGMGQNAHRSILPIKHYRRLALQGCQ